MARVQPTDISDDEVLTQFGECEGDDISFRERPRPTETELSLLRGRLERTDAGQKVRRRREPGLDAARYVSAGELRRLGFCVEHTPSRGIPEHVSVSCEHGWTADVVTAFDSSFEREMDLPGPEDRDVLADEEGEGVHGQEHA